MRITWVIEGRGSGSADTDTAEGAANALRDAVRDVFKDLPPDALTAVLGPVMRLRQPLVTEGRAAVERGDEWSTMVGGIFVTLYP